MLAELLVRSFGVYAIWMVLAALAGWLTPLSYGWAILVTESVILAALAFELWWNAGPHVITPPPRRWPL